MTRWGAVALAGLLILSGCQQSAPPARTLVAAPHYTLGAPYVANGHWYYPAENYALDTTGIASVQDAAAHVTADGEIYDAGALVAAMQTVQLPAVARVTNLENGREIAVRVNDRGPDDPARVIAVSPRAALLLLIPAGGAARVRVALDTRLSHAVVEQVGGGPKLAIATAPAGTVVAQALPPLGTGGAGAATVLGAAPAVETAAAVPERMPEVIYGGRPAPGQLFLRAGTFGRFAYANVLAAKLGGLGGTVLRSREGRQETYAVRAGPFASIAAADAALRRALQAGVVDARISVEDE